MRRRTLNEKRPLNRRYQARVAAGQRGSTLLVALLTTATLSMIVGACLMNVTGRTQTATRSAAWQQAGSAAESASDLAISEIRRILPDLVNQPVDAWSGWTAFTSSNSQPAALPAGKSIPSTVTLKLLPPALVPVSGTPFSETATVLIDAPAGLVDVANRQWLRVRSTGTALVPGLKQASKTKLDNELRPMAFVRDWRSGAAVARPQVSRSIEVIVRPMPLFSGAILSQGKIDANHPKTLVDSYDSSDSLKSSGGEYDSKRSQSNGSVYTNGSDTNFRGTIHGNAGTNGGSATPAYVVDGTYTNAFFQRLLPVQVPVWSNISLAASSVPALTSLTITGAAGSGVNRYKLTAMNGDLTITGAPGTSVEIWVTGDMTGSVHVPAGVQATFYVAGNIRMDGDNLDNQAHRAASLKFYGLEPPAGETRSIELNLNHDIYASIYAPSHSFKVNNGGQLMGSFVVASLTAGSNVQFHYDEALAKGSSPIGDYKMASWVEELR